MDLILSNTRTITSNGGHSLTISGLISQNGSGFGITKGGGATLTLSNGANSFNGPVSITSGTLTASFLDVSGSNSSIGAGNQINIGNAATRAILNFTGSTAPSGPINRTIQLAGTTGGGHINNNGSVPLVFNGPFIVANTDKTLQLGGSNTGANDFQSVLANPAVGVLSIYKSDAGTWTLSVNNTYTGATIIDNGIVNVSTIADVGSSNLGLGTNFRIGNVAASGNLNNTGTSSTTGRTLTIGNNGLTPAVGDTGGARINSNGSGPLVFTAPNFNTTDLVGSLAPARTLTLSGTNTGANEIQGVIADGLSGTMATNVLKTGAGTWMLSGNNTYTGTTSISGGTLLVNGRISSNAAVTVQNANLGGLGSIQASTTIATGGRLAPGNSAGILTFDRNLTFSTGNNGITWELNDNTSTNSANPNAVFDSIVLGGDLIIKVPTGLNLDFDNPAGVRWSDNFWNTSRTGIDGWLLFDVAGTTSGFANLRIANANWADSTGALFSSMRSGASFGTALVGQDVYLTYTASAIPEPNSLLITLIGIGGMLRCRRSRAR